MWGNNILWKLMKLVLNEFASRFNKLIAWMQFFRSINDSICKLIFEFKLKQSVLSLAYWKSFPSSGYELVLFTSTKKRRGLSIDPWETPFSIWTVWVRLLKNYFSRSWGRSPYPCCSSFFCKIVWSKQSKATYKSRKTPCV